MPTVDILLPGLAAAGLTGGRLLSRARRVYIRLMVEPYRGDRTRPEALLAAIAGLQSVVAVRGARRVWGQPSVALEVHLHVRAGGAPLAWLAICVPRGLERQAQAALRASYPNCALRPVAATVRAGAVMRLHKRGLFTNPVRRLEDIDPDRPPVERLLRAMAAAGGASVVQLALTPAPAALGWTRAGTSARPDKGTDTDFSERPARGRGPWFYADVRVVGQERRQVAVVAAELRAGGAANRLVGRRVGLLGRWWLGRRVGRGEGDPLPGLPRRSYAAEEIAGLWQLPSVGFAGVPLGRRAVPVAPAPAGILRVGGQGGLLADEHGRVTIHAELRRQNTAVVGTVEQGKTSYLVASVREDLGREDCAVIVLDPKGDAADAAVSVVPPERVCTLLDLGRPTCGFNPLGVDAPIDAIADFVVAAVRQLFGEGEVKGSSDRYLRNALIGALAFDRRASLWDVARLLEVGPGGVGLRARVAHHLTALPEFAEVASFLADELPGQLADARASTTAKLDAPANKLARVLNSASVKRVLLNTSLTIDFDRLIAEREVLIVRGALGEVGAGNVSVLMQLLVGMLDAALSRAQDRRRGDRAPTAVALKVDEAPLVINAAFAQTMALKRSAGLETVACWQADAQWPEELRQQLDALFAHRVLFATASAEDARAGAGLLMAEFSDQLRTGDQAVATLAAPDVRLHLPRHTAIASWGTPGGRERPFIGRTLRLSVDLDRLAGQAEQQRRRGGRELENLAPPPRLDQLPPATDHRATDQLGSADQQATDQPPHATDQLPEETDQLPHVTDQLPWAPGGRAGDQSPQSTDQLPLAADQQPLAADQLPLAADRRATGQLPSAFDRRATDQLRQATDQLRQATGQLPSAPDRRATDQSPQATDQLRRATDQSPQATVQLRRATDQSPQATDQLPSAADRRATGQLRSAFDRRATDQPPPAFVRRAGDQLPPAFGQRASDQRATDQSPSAFDQRATDQSPSAFDQRASDRLPQAAGEQSPSRPGTARALELGGSGGSLPRRRELGRAAGDGRDPGGHPLIDDAREVHREGQVPPPGAGRQAAGGGARRASRHADSSALPLAEPPAALPVPSVGCAEHPAKAAGAAEPAHASAADPPTVERSAAAGPARSSAADPPTVERSASVEQQGRGKSPAPAGEPPNAGSVAGSPPKEPVPGPSSATAPRDELTADASGAGSMTASPGAGALPGPGVAPPPTVARRTPTESTAPTFLELRAVDAAQAVRWLPVPPGVRTRTLDPAELELLGWIAAAGCALSSQIHRRMSPGRSLTTTQRRLKRLADAGLIARFQLHGGDGGGVPFCCAITAAGLALLGLSGRTGPVVGDETLDRLRRDVHTVGWLLALEEHVGVLSVLGPGRARVTPGDAGTADVVGLDAGLHPRDFLVGDPAAGPRRAVDRFRPLAPAGVAELAGTTDLLVFHEPIDRARSVALVERLDHLISGWWRSVPRYARRGRPPAAVVVCADDCRARALAQVGDEVLTACLARIGQPPDGWEYPGRRGIAFVAESDIHHGRLGGWQVAPVVAPFRPDGSACTHKDPALDLSPDVPGRPLPRWR